jgi:transposase
MKTPTKSVAELSQTQREESDTLMKTATEPVRRRAHSIILSARQYSIDLIADIYEVDRDRVSIWIDCWNQQGGAGLRDEEGRGRKTILTEKEQRQAINIVEQEPRSTKQNLSRIEKETGKKISPDTLRRALKKGNKVWKRLRRTMGGERDEQDFQQVQAELADFAAQAATGEIDLFYFDGAGFTLDPSIAYAWQTRGESISIPAATSDRINVLGFFSTDQRFASFVFEEVIDSEIVIACFDAFCQQCLKPTLVVIDQAPVQTSAAFQARLAEWEKNNLFVYLLPAYSPELNLIEIIWRMIKYHWLPLNAYDSYKDLFRELGKVLKGIGSKYQINFAS